MASLKQVNLLKATKVCHQALRNFHLNPVARSSSSVKWRKERGLTVNPNAFGPLTNLPDYSFKDGRPVPYGGHQKKRIDQQRENLIRIKELVSEIDNAVLKHEARLKAAEDEKQRVLGRKLKEKGSKLLIAAGVQTLKIEDDESRGKGSEPSIGDSTEMK